MPRTHKYGNNPDLEQNIVRRREFEAKKNTTAFKSWKGAQLKTQKGRCAWCEQPMATKNITVDHVLPLYHGGTNNYDNLVLSHRRCNTQKWIRPDTVPQWIEKESKRRKELQRLNSLRQKQQRLMSDLLKQIDLENQASEMKEILKHL